MVSAQNLSHYIVDKCTSESRPVSNLQLQKIMYFLQFVYCKASGGELLFDDEFEAWPYGPVLRDVYTEYSIYGGRVIEKHYSPDECALSIRPDVKQFIDDGVTALRKKYPWDLVRLSHAKESPWSVVYADGAGYRNIIPNKQIIEAALNNTGHVSK